MPLTWKIDQVSRLVVVTVDGSLERQDLEAFLSATAAEGAIGYRVIFDARAADVVLHPSDLAAISKIVRARKSDISSGAIAIVIGSDAEREVGAFFADQTTGERPCRVFSNFDDAKAWVDSLSS